MAENAGEVVDNAAEGRFELALEGGTAVMAYARDGDTLQLTHTEVPAELEGQGVGSRFVKQVLDKARADGLKVAPWCPFVHAYIQRHPEYRDLVAAGE
jgi:predicted GNAT family acetyltransferase